MWYKNSDRGYIDFKDLANKMAGIIYPELEKAKNDFKTEIDQITKNYKILNTYYDSLSKDEQKKELKRYQDFVNIITKLNNIKNVYNNFNIYPIFILLCIVA
jgi:hypothetical protein